MNTIQRYAHLLVHYCLELRAGQKVFIRSTVLAEELIREVYREAVKVGAHPQVDLAFRGKSKIFFDHANDDQLQAVSGIQKHIVEHYDAYLTIRAPYNLREESSVDPVKRTMRTKSGQELNQIFSQRTAEGTMVRTLCQYPTQASAQEAGMSLEEYQQFVFSACHLFDDDPAESWLKIRKEQQHYVDYLNKSKHIRYVGPQTDISFSIDGRTWINSDGRVNMPSGEVFSGPVEDSVNGHVYFDYPSIFNGKEVSGIRFEVKNGEIVSYSAERGEEILDEILKIEGAKYFGEVAIGTNYNISTPTKNILFDEKIGGTIHMAIGQSYIQTGGTNKSVIHWDMISDMSDGGKIYADDKLIYEDGKFII